MIISLKQKGDGERHFGKNVPSTVHLSSSYINGKRQLLVNLDFEEHYSMEMALLIINTSSSRTTLC